MHCCEDGTNVNCHFSSFSSGGVYYRDMVMLSFSSLCPGSFPFATVSILFLFFSGFTLQFFFATFPAPSREQKRDFQRERFIRYILHLLTSNMMGILSSMVSLFVHVYRVHGLQRACMP
ncbi:unnamed protein product [Periconia digitata]|uniref:Uncharacterized protein n=1 Tax=Periconia digitata TaxID=1303443 RepID=A0A9W4XUM6_9PLEO|nr:unnamed protein product [Periconia digitata]